MTVSLPSTTTFLFRKLLLEVDLHLSSNLHLFQNTLKQDLWEVRPTLTLEL
jgi:hypothetical protein